MSLSFAVMVFWSDGTVIQPDARGGPWEPENFESSCLVLGAPPRMATLETCQLVVTWQHCWHGNNVEELNSAWTTDKVYMENLSALHYCKKMTRVYLLGTRTNSFCICCSIYQKTTNLTMLFNVLLTTFAFLSFFLSFFFFKWPLVMPQIIHSKLYIFVFQ